MTTLRKQIIESYLASNSAYSHIRSKVAKSITAYNKANKQDTITTADIIRESFPTLYAFLSDSGSLKNTDILENNFRKLLCNLKCKQRIEYSTLKTSYVPTLSSTALFKEVYGHNSNLTFYSLLYPSLTFKLDLTSVYSVKFVSVENPAVCFYVEDALHLLREF